MSRGLKSGCEGPFVCVHLAAAVYPHALMRVFTEFRSREQRLRKEVWVKGEVIDFPTLQQPHPV